MSERQGVFERINEGYASTYRPGRLSLGLVVPIEGHGASRRPTMAGQLARIRRAEELGFAAVWLRDVPFDVPSFGDAGHLYDPFVYLGVLAASTERIALGVASIVLPLRHPAHVAKAAASADVLSGGRLLLGVASGDRPQEYPALAASYHDRGARFRDAFDYIRRMGEEFASFEGPLGSPRGIDMVPKPAGARLPMLVTGGSQQDPEWIARHGDGWMVYPRALEQQAEVVRGYRARLERAGSPDRPVMQPLYVDLCDDPAEPPTPIHLGFRTGSGFLVSYLKGLEEVGVNHVALNLRFGARPVDEVLEHLAADVLPTFHGEPS